MLSWYHLIPDQITNQFAFISLLIASSIFFIIPESLWSSAALYVTAVLEIDRSDFGVGEKHNPPLNIAYAVIFYKDVDVPWSLGMC